MTVSRGTIALSAFLLVAHSQTAWAQEQPLDLPVEIISDETSDFIHQDHDGFVWLAFGNQIVRFDGATRQVYQNVSFDTTTIGDGYYWSAASTADGAIWLGNFTTGLNRMTGYGGRVERWYVAPDDPRGLTGRAVVRLFVDSKERVWVGTPRGLNLFDEASGSFVHYLHDPSDSTSLPGDFIGALAEDTSGNIWIGTNRGLARYDPESESFERFAFRYRSEWNPVFETDTNNQGLPYEQVLDISIDQTGRIWLIVSQMRISGGGSPVLVGVPVAFDPEARSFQTYEFIDDGLLVGISSIRQDDAGRFWAASQKGLALFDPDDGTFTRANLWKRDTEPIGEVRVREMMLDRQGNLWISWSGFSPGVGRITLAHPGIEVHSTLHGAGPNRAKTCWVQAVLASRDNTTIWFTAVNEEENPPMSLTRLDRATGRETRYSHDPNDPTSLSTDHIREIVERDDGKLWVAGWSGLNLFDPATETSTHYYIDGERVATKPGPGAIGAAEWMDPNNILAIASVSDNELWLAATRPVYVNVETGAKRSYIVGAPSVWRSGEGRVADILLSKAGLIWMIAPPGAVRLDPATGESTVFVHDEVEPTTIYVTNALSIHEDAQGRIWVGGFGGGLNLFEPETETWKHYDHEQGLANKRIRCITHDDLGYIWVSTSHGLTRFDPVTERFETFGADDGVLGLRFARRACSRSATGELFFGGESGFHIVRPDLIPEPPPTVLTAVGVSGVRLRSGLDERLPLPLSQTAEIHLGHNENNLVFEYASIDFGHAGNRNFTYRLDPIEADWQAGGDRNATSYANLAPGEYTFMVRGSVAGRMSRSPASIRIIIAPPWWKTWWAYIMFASLIIGVLDVGYHLRVRRLKAHSERLKREVAERTRELEEEKLKTEEQAQHLLELDHAKNRFFANVSHEFRTPLTLILGPLQDLLDGAHGRLSREAQGQIQMMHRNADRLQNLITELLDLSRADAGQLEVHMQKVDLVAHLEALVQSFVPAAEHKQIKLEFGHDVPEQSFVSDPDMLNKVVGNLLSNALKFTPEGGKVWVTMHFLSADDTLNVEVLVKDTGPGIPREHLSKIFDRFASFDPSYRESAPSAQVQEGVGIGLALAKELVELHKGVILVESEPGFGSTFIVRLPLSPIPPDVMGTVEVPQGLDETATRLEDLAPGHGERPGSRAELESTEQKKATILIVEDNPDVRAYLRLHLSAEYRVVEAANGGDGLEIAKKETPNLVLADVMMPVMDGYELCRALKADKELRNVPFVMLTARAAEADTIEGLGIGADDYIAKPFSMPELKARVANLIHSRQQMRRQFSREILVQPSGISVDAAEVVFLDRVLEIIETHLGDSSFGVEWLADEVGMSTRHLRRRLEALTGEPPADLIRRLRLERASQLLNARAGTVAEVAYIVGYKSHSHFSAAFREAFGVSPSEHVGNETADHHPDALINPD